MFSKNHAKSLLSRSYKLSPSEVLEIISLSQFFTDFDIAEAYSVSLSSVHFIRRGQRWNKVSGLAVIRPSRRNTPRKITKRKADNIRKAYKLGQSQNSLAKKYGISQPTVFDIVHRRTHV